LIEKKIEACREKCFDRRIKTCGPIRDSAWEQWPNSLLPRGTRLIRAVQENHAVA
jgi:hypothetical protein